MPQVTGASTYSISIRATKAGYAKAETTKTVTVGKQTNTNGNLTLSATSGTITYPNNGTFTVTKNTSGGTLSVSSSDTSIATASISGTTVTITPKVPTTDGKKTTITVTSAATSNYEAQTATYVATVNMGKITINATAYSGKYDGKAHPALTAVSTNPTGTTIEYSLNGGTYSTTMPQVTGASTYSISIRATKAGYAKAEKTITVTVNRAKTATASAANKTYNRGSQTGVSGSNVSWSGDTTGTNVGTYTAYATPKTNYAWSDGTTGQKTITWTMSAKAIKDCTITLGTTEYTYAGVAKKPAITVKDGTVTLVQDTEYTVAYSNNTNAGQASVAVSGKGNYSGAVTKTYTIGAKNISNCTVTLGTTSYTYDGSAKQPSVTVKDGTTTLTNGTHYTVAYSNNTNAGTATVTVTGKGNYTGTKTANFTINKASITINATGYSAKYDGTAHNALTSVSTTPTGTTLRYNLDGAGWVTTMPKVTNIKGYSIVVEASKTNYNTATKTITVTVSTPTAADVSYTPSDTSWKVTNVKQALDSLYSR